MIARSGLRCAIAWVCLLMAAGIAHAQVRLTGRVLSDTQEPLRSAAISVRPVPDGARVQAITDGSGAFSIVVPAPGDYLVDVHCAGFFTLADQRASATGSVSSELTFVLEPVREYSETTSVQGQSNALALERNGAEKNISSQELLNAPYPGSESLKNGLRILPGVVQDAFAGIHLNGAPESEVLFLLDGFNIGDPLTGRFNPRISVDAVRSVNVHSGPYSAEYGKGAAGAIEIVTNTGDDRLRYSAATFVPVIGDQKGWRVLDWTPRVSASGPIKAGRAWFTNNANGDFHQYVVPELPRGDDQTWRARVSDHLHAQVNPTTTNILHASALVSVGWSNNNGLSALDPESTTLDVRSRQILFNVRDQQMLAGGALFEVGYGSNRTYVRQTPKGHAPYISRPEGRGGNHYFDGLQESSRDQVLANLFLPVYTFAGTHQIKTGLGFDRIGYDQEITRTEIQLFDTDLAPIRRIAFTGSGSLSASNYEAAAYVQDAWRLSNRVLAQLGVRMDWDKLTSDWSASPRAGLAWSPFSGESTKISGGYATTHDATRLQLFVRPGDQTPVSTLYPPFGTGRLPLRSTFVIPDRLASPAYHTWSLTLDQRLPSNLSVHTQALSRRSDNSLAYFGTPFTDRDTTYTLANDRTESYRAWEISVRQTIGQEYSWTTSYTRSRVRSNAVLDISPDDYFIATDNDGPLDWDAPNRVVSWGYLPTVIRPKWAIAYLVDYRTGFPFSTTNDAGVIVGSSNSYRYLAHFELDLALERRIKLHGHQWALRIGVDNITNHFNATSVNANVNSDKFLQFYGGQDRLLVLRLRWLGRAKS
jgi:outer membrane receptor protein involved in Fe transport